MDGHRLWRPAYGFETFAKISNYGEIRAFEKSVWNGHSWWLMPEYIVSIRESNRSRHLVADVKGTTLLVHRLVLETFISPAPEDKPFGCHYDDNAQNNYIGNLYWGDKSDNERDKVRNGKNFLASKELCVRGHELSGNNLAPSTKTLGYRNCRSCGAAKARLNYYKRTTNKEYNETDVQILSDEYYNKVLEGW